MKRLTINTIPLIAAGFLAISASANASDLLDGLNDPAPAQAEVNWTGGYLGGLAGYGIANYELEGNGFPFSFDGISSRGFQGCGILGAQAQMGVVVAGVEGRGCGANISTDLTFGGNEASLELDYSYAPYAKLGIAHGNLLVSALAGYKWQHVALDALNFDETIEGFSGGLLIENKIGGGNWILGFEMLFTQFEKQDAQILNIDPTLYEGGIRLTYTLGQ